MSVLSISPKLSSELSSYYKAVVEETYIFKNVVSNFPLQTDLIKAHMVVLVMLVPLQFISLLMLADELFLRLIYQKSTSNVTYVFLFFLVCFAMFATILPIGNTGLVRILGGGAIAASLVMPLITSCFPLLLRMVVFIFNNTNSRKV